MTTLYEVERTGIYADLDATVITIAVKNGVVIAALTAAVPHRPRLPGLHRLHVSPLGHRGRRTVPRATPPGARRDA